MWTEITRAKYERKGQRYASDLTDGEWALIEPQLPGRRPLGRPREVALRTVFNALLYLPPLVSGGSRQISVQLLRRRQKQVVGYCMTCHDVSRARIPVINSLFLEVHFQ
jgi:hypothetical protein